MLVLILQVTWVNCLSRVVHMETFCRYKNDVYINQLSFRAVETQHKYISCIYYIFYHCQRKMVMFLGPTVCLLQYSKAMNGLW